MTGTPFGDNDALASWRDAYATFFGEAPRISALEGGLEAVTFPSIPDPFGLSTIMLGSIQVWDGRPAMVSHLQRLGFAWDDQGIIRTSPAPSSLRPMLARVGLDTGFAPRLVVRDSADLLLGDWFGAMCDGLVLINVGSREFYDRHIEKGAAPFTLRAGARLGVKDMAKHFMYVQHDMTKHAVLLHLVPRACIERYGARIKQAFEGIYERWVSDPVVMAHVASPITRFYENDLVIYCDRVHECVRRPEDFPATFADESNHAQLVEQLEQKIALSQDPATAQSLKTGYRPPPYRVTPRQAPS